VLVALAGLALNAVTSRMEWAELVTSMLVALVVFATWRIGRGLNWIHSSVTAVIAVALVVLATLVSHLMLIAGQPMSPARAVAVTFTAAFLSLGVAEGCSY